jgi:hypothetical protein
MNPLLWRIGTAGVLLAGGWFGQHRLESYVTAPGPLPEVPLTKALADLPLQLGEWEGTEREITDEKLLYADQHLQRTYGHPGRRQILSVWLVYSREGEDRGHHPEVCMAVAGKPEDVSGRAEIALPGHPAPVQQYLFGARGDQQWVYYWHYTLLPPKGEELSELQRFYQRLHRRPSSMTLEVFAPEMAEGDGDAAREFVALLDAAIQEHLGGTSVRGSRRTPVTVIRTETPATEGDPELQ